VCAFVKYLLSKMAKILELEDKTIPELLRSYSAYKGWYTKFSGKAVHCNDLLKQTYSRITEQQLYENLTKAEFECGNLTQIVDYLIQAKYEKGKDHQEEVKDFEVVVTNLWKEFYRRQNRQEAPAQQQRVQADEPRGVKIVSDLKPEPLSHDGSAGDLTRWKRQFLAYHSASNMGNARIVDQQAYLLTCVDGEIGNRLIRETTITTPVLPQAEGVKSFFSILTDVFNKRYPIILKRRLFYEARQKDGEEERQFIEWLMSLAEEADIAGMTLNDAVCLMYTTGFSDPKLRQRLGEIDDPTLDRFNAVVDSFVHGRVTANNPATARAAKPMAANKKKTPRKPLSDSERQRRKQFKGRCFRCGDPKHLMPACSMKQDVKCRSCNESGHVSSVCLSNSRAIASADSMPVQPNPAHLPIEYQGEDGSVWSQAGSAHTRSSCLANRQTPELPL
jgi:hypothetical protein